MEAWDPSQPDVQPEGWEAAEHHHDGGIDLARFMSKFGISQCDPENTEDSLEAHRNQQREDLFGHFQTEVSGLQDNIQALGANISEDGETTDSSRPISMKERFGTLCRDLSVWGGHYTSSMKGPRVPSYRRYLTQLCCSSYGPEEVQLKAY
jgi:hypothetical protein